MVNLSITPNFHIFENLELNGIVTQGLSCSWSEDGKLLAASSDKGRIGSIWDPRAGKSPIQELKLHQGMGREARILFAGERIVSSGFSNVIT